MFRFLRVSTNLIFADESIKILLFSSQDNQYEKVRIPHFSFKAFWKRHRLSAPNDSFSLKTNAWSQNGAGEPWENKSRLFVTNFENLEIQRTKMEAQQLEYENE